MRTTVTIDDQLYRDLKARRVRLGPHRGRPRSRMPSAIPCGRRRRAHEQTLRPAPSVSWEPGTDAGRRPGRQRQPARSDGRGHPAACSSLTSMSWSTRYRPDAPRHAADPRNGSTLPDPESSPSRSQGSVASAFVRITTNRRRILGARAYRRGRWRSSSALYGSSRRAAASSRVRGTGSCSPTCVADRRDRRPCAGRVAGGAGHREPGDADHGRPRIRRYPGLDGATRSPMSEPRRGVARGGIEPAATGVDARVPVVPTGSAPRTRVTHDGVTDGPLREWPSRWRCWTRSSSGPSTVARTRPAD